MERGSRGSPQVRDPSRDEDEDSNENFGQYEDQEAWSFRDSEIYEDVSLDPEMTSIDSIETAGSSKLA